MIATRPADAVLIPEALKSGRRKSERVRSIAAITEPLLGCDRRKGQKGYMHRTILSVPHPDDRMKRTNLLFVTKNPNDTMKFPTGHPRHPQDRYRWEKDGPIQLGYLIVNPEEEIGVYADIPRP